LRNATPLPPTVVEGGAGDNGRGRRYWIKPERTVTVADLEAELAERLRAAWPAVREELREEAPAEAAVAAVEIRDGRAFEELPRADLLALASEVSALASPADAAAMLRVMIELRDEDDAAAMLLLMM
jgi:hypothetical protein